MLTKISLKGVASYSDSGVEIYNLNKVNIIYGTNGTGKTTISEFLENSTAKRYVNCKMEWGNTAEKPRILVYNRNFIKESLSQTDAIQGIFTIGENAGGKEEKKKS